MRDKDVTNSLEFQGKLAGKAKFETVMLSSSKNQKDNNPSNEDIFFNNRNFISIIFFIGFLIGGYLANVYSAIMFFIISILFFVIIIVLSLIIKINHPI